MGSRTHGVSTHWLRHTTLTWVERHFGYGVARAYAGHTESTGPATTTYIKADLHTVAAALSAMTGQPHPPGGSEDRLKACVTGAKGAARRRPVSVVRGCRSSVRGGVPGR